METPLVVPKRSTRPSDAIADADLRPARGTLAAAILFLIAGLAALAIASSLDERSRDPALWPNAAFAPEADPPWDGAVRTWVRHVPVNNFPLQRVFHDAVKDSVSVEEFRALPVSATEWFLAIDLPPEAFAPLLETGRLPRKGTDEVLAGAFARGNFVQVDDGAFHVVGRLKRGVGALSFAYVLPDDEVWEPLWFSTATLGWFDPNGLTHLRNRPNPEEFAKRFDIHGGALPTSLEATFAAIGGLVLAAIGGAFLFSALHAMLLRHGPAPFRPAARSAVDHPRLVVFMHILLYGAFFSCMVFTVLLPVVNVLMQGFLAQTFTTGELAYIGEAYSSGNVLRASVATWLNNFVVQTAGMTMLSSVIIPMVGVLKTLGSFALAGLAMAPMWSGMPGRYLFHAITMVLELEAYVFACVAVCAFWFKVVRGIRHRKFGDALHDAAMTLLSATLLAGVMLAIAALYEAATLILLA